MTRQVILYELNEVPWEVVDRYVASRPESELASFLESSFQGTTLDEDPIELMPWRSWPTFHMSRYTPDHDCFDQGQDPSSFRGTPLWDVAENAGLKVGLFGVLQSWPPRRFRTGGFYVPDSFARTDDAFPPELRRFQAFNVGMTEESSFAAERDLSPRQLARVGVDIATKGLTPWSMVRGARQFVAERRDPRYKSGRAMMQVLPCFDLYWRLHRVKRPDLSVFFTNHVASMMHRFWGDWFPGYATSEPYEPDAIYRQFIMMAMDLFDHQLGRIRRWVDAHPESVLIVASSMGQGPIAYRDMVETYVVEDVPMLVDALGLAGASPGVAMYPRLTLEFTTPAAAAAAEAPVASVSVGAEPLFRDFRVKGSTLSFEVAYQFGGQALPRDTTWTATDGSSQRGTLDPLGITVRARPGGGNTAQHVPDGIFLAYGSGLAADYSRRKVSVLDAAPSILDLLGVAPPDDMRGEASIFAGDSVSR